MLSTMQNSLDPEEKNKGMRDEPPCERKPQEISPLKYDFVPNKGDSYI